MLPIKIQRIIDPIDGLWRVVYIFNGLRCKDVSAEFKLSNFTDKRCSGKLLHGLQNCTNLAVTGSVSTTGAITIIGQDGDELCVTCIRNRFRLQIWDAQVPDNCKNKVFPSLIQSLYFGNSRTAAATHLEPLLRGVLATNPDIIYGLGNNTDTHIINIYDILDTISDTLISQIITGNIGDYTIEFPTNGTNITIQRLCVKKRIFSLLTKQISQLCSNDPGSHFCGMAIVPIALLAKCVPVTRSTIIPVNLSTLKMSTVIWRLPTPINLNMNILKSILTDPVQLVYSTQAVTTVAKPRKAQIIETGANKISTGAAKYMYKSSRRSLKRTTNALRVRIRPEIANLVNMKTFTLNLPDCRKNSVMS